VVNIIYLCIFIPLVVIYFKWTFKKFFFM
jgi:hypothetical protein